MSSESGPVPSTPNPTTGPVASRPRWRSYIDKLTGLLSLLALVMALILWQKLSLMQEQLARQSADAGQLSMQANSLAKNAQDLANETAARVALLDTRLSEVALQRTQLEELIQSLSRSRDENMVVDIESALSLAQQQAELTGSVQPMLAALQSAQKRLSKLAQPRLSPVLRAIQHDIDRIQSVSITDTPTLLNKLDELVLLVEELPLLNSVGSNSKAAPAPGKPLAHAWEQAWQSGQWSVLAGHVWQELSQLVRVSRVDQPEAVLLSPEQSFFARENLKLRLLNARLGLLARQTNASRSDLQLAERDIQRFFDVSGRKGQTTLSLLKQTQNQMRQTDLPRLDQSLAALATAAAGR
jgi:uroporphyrin-3 C-methyltransferase